MPTLQAVTDIRLMSDHDMVLDDQSVGRNVLEFLAPLMANTREQEQQAKTIK